MVQVIDETVNSPEVNLYFINDTHLGHACFEKEKFIEHINKIRDDPNAVVILNGDYIDGIVPSDKRFDQETLDPEFDTIEEQYEGFLDLIEPIKEKVIGVGMGNHDITIKDRAQMNIPRMIARQIGTNYFGNVGLFNLAVKSGGQSENHRILVTHGNSRARTVGGIFNSLRKKARNLEVTPDILACGHFHRTDVLTNPKLDDKFNPTVNWLAITGAFLNSFKEDEHGDIIDNYANFKFYGALPVGSVRFTLTCEQGQRNVDPDLMFY